MDEQKIEKLFVEANSLIKVNSKESLRKFYDIVELIQAGEDYTKNEKLLRLFILSAGYIFTLTNLTQWEMAEKSLFASEIYLEEHPKDLEVNRNYLLLSELTYKFKESYQKAVGLLQYDKRLKLLALKFLSSPSYYHEGLMDSVEYEKYKLEYQTLLLE